MSLLRNVLRKNTATGYEPPKELSPKARSSIKVYAASVRSAGGVTVKSARSIAGSVVSFYSTVFGEKIAKRRRAAISRLGVPKWYNKEPPEATLMPGTEMLEDSELKPSAYGYSLIDSSTESQAPPWLSVILYGDAAHPRIRMASYHDHCRVRGEVRMRIDKPDNIKSIDVWVICNVTNVMDMQGIALYQAHVNLWDRPKGSPADPGASSVTHYKGKFPAGVYVFPFEFEPLPKDIQVVRNDTSSVSRIFLPPSCTFSQVGGFSGESRYTVGVNVERDAFMSIDTEYDIKFNYTPRRQPIPREPSPFPFIPLREDWPYEREEIGGWTITPFGGRGQFKGEAVEIEGLLGVQAPEVHTMGQIVPFSIQLWSNSEVALQALNDPASFDVVFVRADLFGTDVLNPKNSSRSNRHLRRLSQGRIWKSGSDRPADDDWPPLKPENMLPAPGAPSVPTVVRTQQAKTEASFITKGATSSRFTEVYSASEAQSEATLVDHDTNPDQDDQDEPARTPSPTPSLEDLESPFAGENVIRLDGDIRIAGASLPSFRYRYMGCEYILFVVITHPDYKHISPNASGIVAETPLWIVTDPPKTTGPITPSQLSVKSAPDLSQLPVEGDVVVEIGPNTIRAPLAKGKASTKMRPTVQCKRVCAF